MNNNSAKIARNATSNDDETAQTAEVDTLLPNKLVSNQANNNLSGLNDTEQVS